jgi:hypothetical protein
VIEAPRDCGFLDDADNLAPEFGRAKNWRGLAVRATIRSGFD